MGRPSIVVLTPLPPATTGNGLAMRSFMFASALAATSDVHVIVVPVAGSVSGAGEASVAPLPDAGQIRAALPTLLGDPAWRDRWSRASPLPYLARMAPPTMAADVAQLLPDDIDVVHVFRSYLAPLGLAVAAMVGARRLTLDLDDDDAAVAAQLGADDESAAYGRLVAVMAPEFDGVAMANPSEAETMRVRLDLPVDVIPNAVSLTPAERRPVAGRLLFVGNLTYGPNVEAVTSLVEDILPQVRRSTPDAHVRVVGPGDMRLAHLAGRAGVTFDGFVDDVSAAYASASAVVVPIAAAAGTRIKLLEAFAHAVPVVTSSAGASGLEVVDGEHVLVADDTETAAASVVRVLRDPALRERLAGAALELVRQRYSYEAVYPLVRRFVTGTATR